MGTTNSSDRIAATLYSLETLFVSGIYVHKGDSDDDDNNNNNNYYYYFRDSGCMAHSSPIQNLCSEVLIPFSCWLIFHNGVWIYSTCAVKADKINFVSKG
jgi:hypothetical protein